MPRRGHQMLQGSSVSAEGGSRVFSGESPSAWSGRFLTTEHIEAGLRPTLKDTEDVWRGWPTAEHERSRKPASRDTKDVERHLNHGRHGGFRVRRRRLSCLFVLAPQGEPNPNTSVFFSVRQRRFPCVQWLRGCGEDLPLNTQKWPDGRHGRKGARWLVLGAWCGGFVAGPGRAVSMKPPPSLWPTAEHENARKPASRDTKGGEGRLNHTEGTEIFVSAEGGFRAFSCLPRRGWGGQGDFEAGAW